MKLSITKLPYLEDSNPLLQSLSHLDHLAALESAAPENQFGRWSIITASPINQLKKEICSSRISNTVEKLLSELDKCESTLPFTGGVIGHASYGDTENNSNPPIISAFLYSWAFLIDHKDKVTLLVYWHEASNLSKTELLELFHGKQRHLNFDITDKIQANWSKSQYKKKIDKIQQYILAGDCYQINLTQAFTGKYTGSPLIAYQRLKQQSYSPFLTYFDFGDQVLTSASPELFLSIKNNIVTTKPIKGTIARKPNPEDDKLNILKLEKSPKDRAENIMITDLLRNDLSKTCTNIKTPSICKTESFESVHHLVSTITGNKAHDNSELDVFIQAFPGGSITGAPKKRAMEIINELEDFNRGLYCGSTFYWSCNGNFNSNILIRSFIFKDGEVNCWAGGGITIDSKWDSEYQESLDKISRLISAIEG